MDLKIWEVATWEAKRYQGFFRNRSVQKGTKFKNDWQRTAKVVTMWSVSVKLKRRQATATENLAAAKDVMMAEMKAMAPTYNTIIYPHVAPSLESFAVELFAPDPHHGKLAWAPETGSNWDSNLSESVYGMAIDHLMARARDLPISLIYLPLGNDFFHTDTPNNTTTAGTQMDTDTRWKKTFKRMREMIVRKVEQLRTIAPVKIVIVPGNHDETKMFYLGDALECRFCNCPDVQVDNTPPLRKYDQFGITLLGWAHGDKEKALNYPMLMAHEAKAMFAQSRYYEWHLGHLHTRKENTRAIADQVNTDTIDGVVIRRIPSLCGTDFWHHGKGYAHSPRQADMYLWSDQRAYAGHFSYSYFGEKG